MNKLLKLSVPLLAIIGIVLLAIGQQKNIGLLMTFFLTPIFLIYVLINLKKEIKHFDTKLRTVLIPTVIINVLFIVLQVIFKTQHYPGAGIFRIIGGFLSVASLIVGLIYFIVNRKSQTTTFTYELILLLFPAFIFIWYLIPFNVPPQLNQEYVKMINVSIQQNEFTNSKLADTSCINPNLELVRELKKDIILNTGGLNEQGELYGFYNQSVPVIIRPKEGQIKELPIDNILKEQLLKARIAGDAVFILTQIETQLLVKNCLQHCI